MYNSTKWKSQGKNCLSTPLHTEKKKRNQGQSATFDLVKVCDFDLSVKNGASSEKMTKY